MGLFRSSRDREVRRIGARLEALLSKTSDFTAGQGSASYEEIADQLFGFIKELTPSVPVDPVRAGAVFDAARASLILESAAHAWPRACAVGLALAGSVAKLATVSAERGEKFLPSGFWERLRGVADEAVYAAHRAASPTGAAWIVESITGGSYTTRQLVQEIPVGDLEALADWAEREARSLSNVPLVTFENGSSVPGLERAAWGHLVQQAEASLSLPPDEMLAFSIASGSITPLAARISRRDIVYLVAGSRGGAAIRFFHGDKVSSPPQHIDLPDCGLADVRRFREQIEQVYSNASRSGRRAVARKLEAIGDEIGRAALLPLHAEWPDLHRVALIPFGEMQSLPLTNARLFGDPWSSLVDTTVAPNAQCLLVSSLQPRTTASPYPVVLGDPGFGESYLPWVEPEVEAVAAVYSPNPARRGDVQNEHADDDATGNLRELRMTKTQVSKVAEGVLDKICRADIVHLACHGLVPAGGERLPLLYLNGVLSIDELEGRRLRRGSVFVLSACSAGGSLREAPLELLGFPATLLSIGASAVIASMWPVPDSKDTVQFMVDLHRQLLTGLSPSAALAAATAAAVRVGVPYSVWGSYAVYGA